MAGRPPKKGIDYGGWSVDIFDNEPKFDKLLDAQGWQGFGVYFFLCQRAYGGEGYFYKWCYDDCATTARKMGGFMGAGTVKEAVGYCLQVGLFDERLFVRWGVLTSRGIQKRYNEVIKGRNVRQVITEYWLLHDDENCEGLIKSSLNTNLSEGNTDYRDGNSNFETGNGDFGSIKESKGKENKGKESNNYQLIADAYNNICISFPKCQKLSEKRKKAINARLNIYTIDDFQKVFIMAEESNYLKGSNKYDWMADFDWLIKDSNMAKVLEGKYKNRKGDTNERHNDQNPGPDENGLVQRLIDEGFGDGEFEGF